jgi:hypothetical protein
VFDSLSINKSQGQIFLEPANLLNLLSPTIHKFGDEFIHSGLSAVRQAHRPELIEGLSEYGKVNA